MAPAGREKLEAALETAAPDTHTSLVHYEEQGHHRKERNGDRCAVLKWTVSMIIELAEKVEALDTGSYVPVAKVRYTPKKRCSTSPPASLASNIKFWGARDKIDCVFFRHSGRQ